MSHCGFSRRLSGWDKGEGEGKRERERERNRGVYTRVRGFHPVKCAVQLCAVQTSERAHRRQQAYGCGCCHQRVVCSLDSYRPVADRDRANVEKTGVF